MTHNEAGLPAVPSALKLRNREMVLACFQDHQEHTVADIVARTGISKLTVMRAIQFFCAKGILVAQARVNPLSRVAKSRNIFASGIKSTC